MPADTANIIMTIFWLVTNLILVFWGLPSLRGFHLTAVLVMSLLLLFEGWWIRSRKK